MEEGSEDAQAIEENLVQLNKEGMEFLSYGNYQECHRLLKMAESLLKSATHLDGSDSSKLYALTMNNLGCYYKKISKPNVALRYMKQALEREEESQQPKSHIASTKLNICAILSQMRKHRMAIDFVSSAIRDL
jgi:tetratricopeptide (TPR) repeat protein